MTLWVSASRVTWLSWAWVSHGGRADFGGCGVCCPDDGCAVRGRSHFHCEPLFYSQHCTMSLRFEGFISNAFLLMAGARPALGVFQQSKTFRRHPLWWLVSQPVCSETGWRLFFSFLFFFLDMLKPAPRSFKPQNLCNTLSPSCSVILNLSLAVSFLGVSFKYNESSRNLRGTSTAGAAEKDYRHSVGFSTQFWSRSLVVETF